ncbi:MAG TPA: DNA-binding transcriptional regulator [Usitatibacter sp.]|jgi:putative transcriptional regulator|nr:DNA-binding transcriptional regulator [Usitatibacter sp.]
MNRGSKTGKTKRAKSGAFEAIHSAAAGLHRAGAIDKATMKEYEELCLKPTKEVTAKDVVRIRARAKVSQNLFARYLNTSASTVQKWETGAKKPGAIASKLLRVVEKHGLDVLA